MAALLNDARTCGAQALVGGELPGGRGWFYPATVLSGVAGEAVILGTEIFGPVASVVTVSGEAEAVELANSTDLGLACYVFTRDLASGLRVSEALESGMVGLNRGLVSGPAAPFGGTNRSGLGREGSSEGIYEYLETKYIACQWW